MGSNGIRGKYAVIDPESAWWSGGQAIVQFLGFGQQLGTLGALALARVGTGCLGAKRYGQGVLVGYLPIPFWAASTALPGRSPYSAIEAMASVAQAHSTPCPA